MSAVATLGRTNAPIISKLQVTTAGEREGGTEGLRSRHTKQVTMIFTRAVKGEKVGQYITSKRGGREGKGRGEGLLVVIIHSRLFLL